MLKAAIDESGTHENAPVLCVAVCVATTRQWELLQKDWEQIAQSVVPPGKYYHAKKAPALLNKKLAELIVRRMDFILAVTISNSEYVTAASHRFRSEHGSAYALALNACLFQVGRWSHKFKGGAKIAYVIEGGHRNQSKADGIFAALAIPELRKRSCVASHMWAGKGEILLHAPDLISHEVTSCFGGVASDVLVTLEKYLLRYHMDIAEIEKIIAEVEVARTEGRVNSRRASPLTQ